MNRRLLLAAALALPLIGLGASWFTTHRASRQGTVWEVPVQGYDPRDLLQGHYVQYQYDWPGLDGDDIAPGQGLCLEGTAPKIDRVVATAGSCRKRVAPQANRWDNRLYASQESALRMQRQLGDPKLQGVLRFRLRPDGQIMPLGMTFRPRPPSPEPRTDPVP